ncbi:hypothetical protein [Oceanivirga miroungae]|uniref:Antitoxin epsilon/PezA domain-containing protein n=1 Tax=Oceanivirga miroungae TaxID=1130046 RepID=A0A6I8M9K1_9FUSO|nr:hypothetical protein [Oceanivirga miroungae]VWL84939.1 hypothetical protein OMES3154_00212 [Oceanivirga miroungae]
MLDYKITLEKEVLREKSSGILADFYRFFLENEISETNKKILLILDDEVTKIYRNIFGSEYDSFEKLHEANGKLDLASSVLKRIEDEKYV